MKAFNSTLQQMIEGTKVFAVPLYQRRYSWTQANWRSYWRSVLDQYDVLVNGLAGQPAPTHFIGSFVLAPAPGSAAAPTRFIVVDGQQRLTTTMVLLAAIRDTLSEEAGEETTRQALVAKFNTLYLHNTFETEELKRLRLLPTQQDRPDYESCVGRTPAHPVGMIGEAYEFFRSSRCLRGPDLQGQELDLNLVAEVLLTRFSLVEIQTESGDNVHRIFQTLNSAGVKLKQVDLLRNHFFMLLPTRGEELYGTLWRQMELSLGEQQLDRFFWAELVRRDARVSRTDVYAAMQIALEPFENDESAIEDELVRFHQDSAVYQSILEERESTPATIEQRLSFLRSWGSDTARPLILEVLISFRNSTITEEEAVECLRVVESFLVRRMVAGIPTNNLNRIFSSLTPVLARNGVSSAAIATTLGEGQKYWPSDSQVVEAVLARPFYFSGQPHQRRMILWELERAVATKEVVQVTDAVSIEHILPQEPTAAWLKKLSSDPVDANAQHERLVHTLGNLTLSGYNSELGNRSYEEKREIYLSSNVALSREIGTNYEDWAADEIRDRSRLLAARIVALWPGPSVSSIDIEEFGIADLEEVILALPPSCWTTISDLIELTALPGDSVAKVVRELPESLGSRVREASEGSGSTYFPASRLRSLLEDSVDVAL